MPHLPRRALEEAVIVGFDVEASEREGQQPCRRHRQ
jgi:hypothetical protein